MQHHAATAGLVVEHGRTVVYGRSAVHGPLEQAVGEAMRIDLRRRPRHQRRVKRQRRLASHTRPIPKPRREAVASLQSAFGFEQRNIRPTRCAVETFPLTIAARPFVAGREFAEAIHRVRTQPERAHRPRFADPSHQLDRRRIEIVLEQARARGSAAGTDVAPIEDHHRDPRLHQFVRHAGAGDASAHDGDVAGFGTLQRRIRGQQAVLDRPVGMSRKQIHGGETGIERPTSNFQRSTHRPTRPRCWTVGVGGGKFGLPFFHRCTFF